MDPSELATLRETGVGSGQRNLIAGGFSDAVLALGRGLGAAIEERAQAVVARYAAQHLRALLCADGSEARAFLSHTCELLDGFQEGGTSAGLAWSALGEAVESDLRQLPASLAGLEMLRSDTRPPVQLFRLALYLVAELEHTTEPRLLMHRLAERVHADDSLRAVAGDAMLVLLALVSVPSVEQLPEQAVVGLVTTLALDGVSQLAAVALADLQREAVSALGSPQLGRVDVEGRSEAALSALLDALVPIRDVLRFLRQHVTSVTESNAGVIAQLEGRIAALQRLEQGLRTARELRRLTMNSGHAEAVRQWLVEGFASERHADPSDIPGYASWGTSGPAQECVTALVASEWPRPSEIAELLRSLLAQVPALARSLLGPIFQRPAAQWFDAADRLTALGQRLEEERSLAHLFRRAAAQLDRHIDAHQSTNHVVESASRDPEQFDRLANAWLCHDHSPRDPAPDDAALDQVEAGTPTNRLCRRWTTFRDDLSASCTGPDGGTYRAGDLSCATRGTWSRMSLASILGAHTRNQLAGRARSAGVATSYRRSIGILRSGAAITDRRLEAIVMNRALTEAHRATLRTLIRQYAEVPRRTAEDLSRHARAARYMRALRVACTAGDGAQACVHSVSPAEAARSAPGPVRWSTPATLEALREVRGLARQTRSALEVVGDPEVSADVRAGQLVVLVGHYARAVELALRLAGGGDRLTLPRSLTDLLGAIVQRDPGALVASALGLIAELTAVTRLGEHLPPQAVRALAFGAQIASAESEVDIQRAIEQVADPPGSYEGKRRAGLRLYVQALFGLTGGGELYLGRSHFMQDELEASFGAHVSAGFYLNVGPLPEGVGVAGIYLPLVDVTPFTSLSVSDQQVLDLDPISILSPGLYGWVGIANTPLVVALGASFTPNGRALGFTTVNGDEVFTRVHAFRFQLLFGVDVTLLGL